MNARTGDYRCPSCEKKRREAKRKNSLADSWYEEDRGIHNPCNEKTPTEKEIRQQHRVRVQKYLDHCKHAGEGLIPTQTILASITWLLQEEMYWVAASDAVERIEE